MESLSAIRLRVAPPAAPSRFVIFCAVARVAALGSIVFFALPIFAFANSPTIFLISDNDAESHSASASVAEAYRNANLFAGMETPPADLTTVFDKLRDEFNQKAAGTFSADAAANADRFWVELETRFLPALQRRDKTSVADSLVRLESLYAACCGAEINKPKIVAPQTQISNGDAAAGPNVIVRRTPAPDEPERPSNGSWFFGILIV